MKSHSHHDGWMASILRVKRGGIATSLLIRVCLFSTVLTLILTFIQLAFTYHSEISRLQSRFDEINKVNSLSLSENLWALDTKQLQEQLDGILSIRSIRAVEVREIAASAHPFRVFRGERQTTRSMVKEMPLFCCGDNPQQIGVLRIEATLNEIYDDLVSQAFLILLGNAIKTFLVAMFILFITHRLAIRHLLDIAMMISRFTPGVETSPLRLRRPPCDDELEQLVDAINVMRKKLHTHATELATANRRMATLLDNIPDMAWVKDTNGRYIAANRACAVAKGFVESGQMVGKTDFDIQPLRFALAYRAADVEVMASGRGKRIEEEHVNANGARSWIETIKTTLYDGNGRVAGTVGIARDINQRRYAEELLHAREQEFRAMVENSPDMIARYDTRCYRIYVNPALQREFGLPIDEILDTTPLELSPMQENQDYMQQIQQVLQSSLETQMEIAYGNNPNALRWGHIRLVPELGTDGAVISVLSIMRDITAVKQVERHLEESRMQLRGLAAKNEAVREEERKNIAREVHDELGQILTGLQMDVSMLSYKFGQDMPALREHLAGTLELVNKSLMTVRNVASALRPGSLDMGIVFAIGGLADRFFRDSGIACEMFVRDEDMDISLSESINIALFRITQESLTNIARHAKASKVEIAIFQNDNDCVLEVRDNGRGINFAILKKETFGLLGIRERVHMLGGELVVDSSLGIGTTIKVRIPTCTV